MYVNANNDLSQIILGPHAYPSWRLLPSPRGSPPRLPFGGNLDGLRCLPAILSVPSLLVSISIYQLQGAHLPCSPMIIFFVFLHLFHPYIILDLHVLAPASGMEATKRVEPSFAVFYCLTSPHQLYHILNPPTGPARPQVQQALLFLTTFYLTLFVVHQGIITSGILCHHFLYLFMFYHCYLSIDCMNITMHSIFHPIMILFM